MPGRQRRATASILDSSAFIEPKDAFYRFSFCPAYWDWILDANRKGAVFSVEKVRDELLAGTDDLGRWAAANSSSLFLWPDNSMTSALTNIAQWVASREFTSAAINQYLGSAHCFLAAHGLAYGFTVVVLVDEAHRTTGGDLGNYLLAAIPNATYIGFTLALTNGCGSRGV